MRIKELYIYPIKGLRGVSIEHSNVINTGLEYDRMYMIADATDGDMISQRKMKVLTQMTVSRMENSWRVHYLNQHIDVFDNTFSNTPFEVVVWDSRFVCNEVSKKHSDWFSKLLNKEVKLVAMPETNPRVKDLKIEPFKTPLSFSDGYPILTLGTRSMEHLNSKLDKAIDLNRFRPNIVIETLEPHEEDGWSDFEIGSNATFRNIKPCVRCEVIMIDQDSGERGNEPLKTLAKYRKFDNEVYFGSNVIVLKQGQIQVGDELRIIRKE